MDEVVVQWMEESRRLQLLSRIGHWIVVESNRVEGGECVILNRRYLLGDYAFD